MTRERLLRMVVRALMCNDGATEGREAGRGRGGGGGGHTDGIIVPRPCSLDYFIVMLASVSPYRLCRL